MSSINFVMEPIICCWDGEVNCTSAYFTYWGTVFDISDFDPAKIPKIFPRQYTKDISTYFTELDWLQTTNYTVVHFN